MDFSGVFLISLILVSCEVCITQCLDDKGDDDDKIGMLFQKIAELEKKNAFLEEKLAFEVGVLTERISELEKTCGEPEPTSDRREQIVHSENTGRPVRQLPVENLVAFFAVVTPHELDHLGVNQNIIFDQPDTNIGKAYNPTHGIFTAPVDGTYVFSATVTGKHLTENTDYYAHFDVNGRTYAKFITFPNEQSSQTIVVQLSTGDNVSVKNNLADDGVLGAMFTTFSGFLLYEGFADTSSIVG